MWLKKYSRVIVQLLLLIVCAGAALWGVRSGLRWAPLLAFFIYLLAGMLILPKLPSPISQPITVRGALTVFTWVIRAVGIVALLGCILLLASYPFLSNPLPLWALTIVLLMWGIWGAGCFWLARWISNKASKTDPSQVLDLGLISASRDKSKL
jgi:hypothetical protein